MNGPDLIAASEAVAAYKGGPRVDFAALSPATWMPSPTVTGDESGRLRRLSADLLIKATAPHKTSSPHQEAPMTSSDWTS